MKRESQLHDPTLRRVTTIAKRMSLFNDSECADVNGECRYIDEMNVNHFFTITSCFFVIVHVAFLLLSYST